jgi:hypothetical protein
MKEEIAKIVKFKIAGRIFSKVKFTDDMVITVKTKRSYKIRQKDCFILELK